MSQRDSGYERKERDCYETPEWVTGALCPHIPGRITSIWEPACGSGKMVDALRDRFVLVYGSDIETGHDFLKETNNREYDAIVTNPPYALAEQFICHACKNAGFVAMLLRTDYDHAKTRQYLFGKCPTFSKKLVLTQRIRWIEGTTGSPSFNHAWFIWDHKHEGQPVLAYR